MVGRDVTVAVAEVGRDVIVVAVVAELDVFSYDLLYCLSLSEYCKQLMTQ